MAREADDADFLDSFDELMRRYGEARHDDVLTLALEISRRFPHRRATRAYIVACAYCLTGAPDDAVRALEEAAGEGHWWAHRMLRNDPDLEPLQGRADFESLVTEAERRQHLTAAGAQSELIVTDPAARARSLGRPPGRFATSARTGRRLLRPA